MSEPAFYVGSERREQLTGFVPAKFLTRNGEYVMDPTPGGSQRAFLYSDGLGNNKTHGKIANPENYLIVPANYSEERAKDFAAQIADAVDRVYPGDDTGAAGLHQALGQMSGAFSPGGLQDLQRHPQWGIPKGSIAPAFVGSASNHLGYVTGLAGLPMPWSEIGGGLLNGANSALQSVQKFFGKHSDPIDTDGPYWLSRQNHANIVQGYSDGLAASKPTTPFNDYGAGAQVQPNDGKIGEGNGIAGWTSSLVDVDPDEAKPATWPPLADRPIRYLGRRVQ